jgi:hypothetical protein
VVDPEIRFSGKIDDGQDEESYFEPKNVEQGMSNVEVRD